MKSERICSKVRQDLGVEKEKAQVNSNELFSQHFSSANIIWSQHPYEFRMNSLKVTIKTEAKAVVQIFLEYINESEVFLKMPQGVKSSQLY